MESSRFMWRFDLAMDPQRRQPGLTRNLNADACAVRPTCVRLSFQRPAGIALTAVLLFAGCQPSGPEALQRGDAALRAGNSAEAIRLLELAATKLPTDAEVWNRLGLAYHDAGRTTEAQKAYLRALEFNRNLFDVHFNLGELLLEQSLFREAEARYRTYLNASPDNARNADAWRGVGLALQAQRQNANAEVALNNAVQLDPADAVAWNALGLARIQSRKTREAFDAFQRASKADPNLASARLNLAVTAHQHLGDRRAALQHYRDFLNLQSQGPEADAARIAVRDLEIRLGLVRPEPALTSSNSAPSMAAPSSSRPPERVPAPSVAPSNPPPRSVVVSNPPPKPVVVVSNPPPKPVVVVTTPPPPAVVAVVPPPAPIQKVVTPEPLPPAPKPKPEPEPAPKAQPLQVVRVDEEPPPRPASDRLPVPVPETRPVEPVPVPEPAAEPDVADARASRGDVAVEPESAAGDAKKSRSLWQKANPVTWGNPVKWFKKDAATATAPVPATRPKPAPKPTAPVAKPAAVPSVASKPVIKVTPLPPAPKPEFPRYQRLNPVTPVPGDRAAAAAEFQRGIAAHERGDATAAIAAYRRAVGLDPSHFEAQHNLSLAALQQGDVVGALKAGEMALVIQPQSALARYNFAVALQRGRYPADAAEELEKVTVLNPDDANAQVALASLCAGTLQEPARARAAYRRVLEINPNHPQAENIRRWLELHPGP